MLKIAEIALKNSQHSILALSIDNLMLPKQHKVERLILTNLCCFKVETYSY